MSEEPTEMMRRVAAADALPVETDAPETDANPVPYDPGLQAELLEHGPAALKDYGRIMVRDVSTPERYNAAVWYALGHDLRYELRHDGVLVIWDPGDAAA